MKKIGVLGGIGWPSTMDYYRLICEASQQYHLNKSYTGPTPMPEIVIESLNMNYTINHRGSSDDPSSWQVWDTYFQEALARLEKSGAEIILIASVTPHSRFAEITRNVSVPVLSVFQAVGELCESESIQQLLILGTMPTMSSSAFANALTQYNVDAVYPKTDELKQSVVSLIEDLYRNNTEGAEKVIDELVRQCIPDRALNTTSVCLGCTELPLAFSQNKNSSTFLANGIQYINSSVVHATAIFNACVDADNH